MTTENTPQIYSFPQMAWQPHPTLDGVQSKRIETGVPHDVLLAQVASQNEIPWHVHPEWVEVAYILNGQGLLRTSPHKTHEPYQEYAVKAGEVMVIPAGLWHCVINPHDTPMEIFAIHTQNAQTP